MRNAIIEYHLHHLPEMRHAGVRVLPLALQPKAGVVVPSAVVVGVVREVLDVTPAMWFSTPSFGKV